MSEMKISNDIQETHLLHDLQMRGNMISLFQRNMIIMYIIYVMAFSVIVAEFFDVMMASPYLFVPPAIIISYSIKRAVQWSKGVTTQFEAYEEGRSSLGTNILVPIVWIWVCVLSTQIDPSKTYILVLFTIAMTLGIGIANILTYQSKATNFVFGTSMVAITFIEVQSSGASAIPLILIVMLTMFLVRTFFQQFLSSSNSLVDSKLAVEHYNVKLEQEREKSHRQARTDSLTGIPNRLSFFETLESYFTPSHYEDEAEKHYGVLICDLNKFKSLNDSYGHYIGDEVLKEFAQRLTKACKGYGHVARLGGDEFAAVLEFNPNQNVKALVDHISQTIQGQFQFEEHSLNLAMSGGLAIFPEAGQSSNELIKNADYALYRVKADKTNGILMYDNDCRAVQQRDALADQLIKRAIRYGEFEIVLQEIVDVTTDKSSSQYYEALSRWTDIGGRHISPELIIKKADEQDLSVKLAYRLFVASVEAINKLPPSSKLSFNISAGQFSHPDFADLLLSWLNETGFDPSRLMIEISENTILADIDQNRHNLDMLRQVGVLIAIDDFGQGNTSLSILRPDVIDVIKIDKVLLQDARDNANAFHILKRLGDLIADMGISGIVEGVETHQDLDIVKQTQFKLAQGYLYGKPKAAERLIDSRSFNETKVFLQAS